jgi:hypothetical protein
MKRYYTFLILIAALAIGCEDKPTTPPINGSYPDPATEWVNSPFWDISKLGVDTSLIPVGTYDLVNTDWVQNIPTDATTIDSTNVSEETLNNPSVNFFVVAPGDYSDLERIDLNESGTTANPKVIYCPSGDCIFEAFYHRNTDHWIIRGVTFTGQSKVHNTGWAYGDVTVIDGDNNTYDFCTWSNSGGIRIRGNCNTLQRSIGKDKPQVPTDTGLFRTDAGMGEESRGNRMIGCYTDGLGDGGGVVWDDNSSAGSCPETVIAFNCFPANFERTWGPYGEQVTCSENGFDCKNGAITDLLSDRSYFIGNISQGHRPTNQSCGGTGSIGSGFLFHRRSRNWAVWGNISVDDTQSFEIKRYTNGPKDKVENIDVRWNLCLYPSAIVFDTVGTYPPYPRQDLPEDGAAAEILCRNCTFANNIIIGAEAGTLAPDTWQEVVYNNDVTVENNYIYPPLADMTVIETTWGNITIPRVNEGL